MVNSANTQGHQGILCTNPRCRSKGCLFPLNNDVRRFICLRSSKNFPNPILTNVKKSQLIIAVSSL